MRSIALLLLGFVSTAEAAEVERLTGPVPGEVEAFEETLLRFRARVAELEAETQRALGAQKAAQLADLSAQYDRRVSQLDDARREQRKQAIARFESFLTTYDGIEWTSDVRLRLAELVFQEEQDAWYAAADAHSRALETAGDDLDALARLEEMGEPTIRLQRVVELLSRIIADNKELAPADRFPMLDVAYYMLAFCYSNENSAQYERALARSTFEELVRNRPDSEYADAAHLILGNYLFEDNQLPSAIPQFEAVIARGPEFRHYSAAVYQLAWTRYKLSQYDEAMKLFVSLLDESEAGRKAGRKPSEYAKDAVTYLALSLSDQADLMSITAPVAITPRDRVNSFFKGLGAERSYEWDVMRELADALTRYDRRQDAVEVYEALQTRAGFELRAENPEFQIQAIKLLSLGRDADLVAAGEARLEMTRRYGEGTAWWNANRANPDALAKASKYIESSLLEVATEVRVRAQETGDPALFAQAADKYREYLDKFPISDDYFENEFILADSLDQAGKFEESATVFSDLVKNERFHKYGDVSVYRLFLARDQLLRDKVGPPDQTSPTAEIERTYTSVGGVEMTVKHLDDTQKAFVQAADTVLKRPFGEPVDGLDARAEVEKNRVKIMYLPAQVLFFAGRYEEARPRLQEIIDRFPSTDEAAWAANLMLTSFANEKDAAQVRKYSREYATLRLGGSRGVADAKAQQFQDTLERATFELANQAVTRGDYGGAAVAFLDFVSEFPKSPNVPVALLNAADNYDRLGRANEANAIYERFITEFPTHPEAKPYYFVIASNYEAIFQLDKAIGIYQQLVDRFPDYERASEAQYMVAFLKEGIGDKVGAAQGYETYAKKYPALSDREAVHFRAGALYEQIDAERAIRFYRGYLAQYDLTAPDHAVKAQYRISKLLASQGKPKEASAALDELVGMFDRVVGAGKALDPSSRDMVAESAFRALQSRYDKIAATQLSRNEEKDTVLLTSTLRAEVDKFTADTVTFTSKYLSFEYATAAGYLAASAQAAYAKLGLSFEPPAIFQDEERDQYIQLLEEKFYPLFYPIEDAAVSTFESVIALGKDSGRHSVWIDRTYEALNRLRPEKYPAARRTLDGSVDVRVPPVLVPISASPSPAVQPAGGAPTQETP